MKSFVFLLVLVIQYHSFSQSDKEFIISDEYVITEIDNKTLNNYWKNDTNAAEVDSVSVVLKTKDNNELYKIDVSNLEFYSGTSLTILEINSLDNIKHVLNLTLAYNSCCSNYYSNYVLVTTNDDIIELPTLDNMHCDGPTAIFEYRFPNQKYGKDMQILLVKTMWDDSSGIRSMETIKAYAWNGTELSIID